MTMTKPKLMLDSLEAELSRIRAILKKAKNHKHRPSWLPDLEKRFESASLLASRIRLFLLGIPTGYFNGVVGRDATFGVEVILIYTAHGLDDAEATVKDITAKGMLAMVEVVRTTPYDPKQVDALIKRLRKYSAICAWYLIDEPTNANPPFTTDDAFKAYTQIRELDPGRPIAMAFPPGVLEINPDYAKAMDIFMPDYYPINNNGISYNEFASPDLVDYYKNVLIKLGKQIADNFNLTLWPIIQAWNPAGGVASPTLLEERYIIYAAVQAGAEGLFFWEDDDGGNNSVYAAQWAQAKLPILMKEYKKYRYSFGRGQFGQVDASPATVVATLYQEHRRGEYYVLLLIHHGPGIFESNRNV